VAWEADISFRAGYYGQTLVVRPADR